MEKPRDSEHQLQKPVEASEKQAYEKPRLEHHGAWQLVTGQEFSIPIEPPP